MCATSTSCRRRKSWRRTRPRRTASRGAAGTGAHPSALPPLRANRCPLPRSPPLWESCQPPPLPSPPKFARYKGLPEATAATLDLDTNLLHTGDLGHVVSAQRGWSPPCLSSQPPNPPAPPNSQDKQGYVFITGRKKDLLITAGGENVAPTPIEQTIVELLGPSVAGHAVLIGDRRKFLSCLVAPPEGKPGAVSEELLVQAVKTYNLSYSKSRAQSKLGRRRHRCHR